MGSIPPDKSFVGIIPPEKSFVSIESKTSISDSSHHSQLPSPTGSVMIEYLHNFTTSSTDLEDGEHIHPPKKFDRTNIQHLKNFDRPSKDCNGSDKIPFYGEFHQIRCSSSSVSMFKSNEDSQILDLYPKLYREPNYFSSEIRFQYFGENLMYSLYGDNYSCDLNWRNPSCSFHEDIYNCLLYTSPSPRDRTRSRMPSSA